MSEEVRIKKMQVAMNKIDLRHKDKKPERIVLTIRDLDVLEFVMDMKFASFHQLFDRFFKKTHSGREATTPEFMRRRLNAPEKAGYLKSEKSFAESTKYYVIAKRGYQALCNLAAGESMGLPLYAIDHRTFYHDKMVIEARTELEQTLGITEWVSDRRLRNFGKDEFGFRSGMTPDGVYRLPTGEWIGFELEIANKDRERYREKIESYKYVIREMSSDPAGVRRIHFWCYKKYAFERLKDYSSVYKNEFLIELKDWAATLLCPIG